MFPDDEPESPLGGQPERDEWYDRLLRPDAVLSLCLTLWMLTSLSVVPIAS